MLLTFFRKKEFSSYFFIDGRSETIECKLAVKFERVDDIVEL